MNLLKEAAAKGLTVGCYRLKTKSHSVIDTQGSTEVSPEERSPLFGMDETQTEETKI